MSWFHKLFAPEVESLRRQLTEAENRETRLQEQIDELKFERETYKTQWQEEIRAGRIIEDALRNQLLNLANLPNLPARETLKTNEETSDNLSEEDELMLTDRATDYCIQKYGVDFSKDKFDQVLAAMVANPDEWLTD